MTTRKGSAKTKILNAITRTRYFRKPFLDNERLVYRLKTTKGKKQKNQTPEPSTVTFTTYFRNPSMNNVRKVYFLKKRKKKKQKKDMSTTLADSTQISGNVQTNGISEDLNGEKEALNDKHDLLNRNSVQLEEEKRNSMVAIDEIRSDLHSINQQNNERFMFLQNVMADIGGIGSDFNSFKQHIKASTEKLDLLNRKIDNLAEEKQASTTPNQHHSQQGKLLGDSDIKLSAIWNYLKNYGEPRLVVSVISSNDTRTSMYGMIDHTLLKKAIHHVANSAGRCGFIYKERDTYFVQGIVTSSCSIESVLENYKYGYFSVHIADDPTEQIDEYKKRTKIDNHREQTALLELQKYINSKVQISFGHDSSETDFARPLPEKKYVKLQKKVVLGCEKHPAIWVKNEQKINNDEHICITHNNGKHVLTISDMTKNYIGTYSCIYGSSEMSWEIEIGETDSPENLPGKQIVQLGSSVELELKLGRKYTAIWLKDKHNLKDDNNIVIEQLNGFHSLTVIDMKRSDVGRYSCICGSAETTCDLKKEELPLEDSVTPLFQKIYADKGKKVTLTCELKTKNPPKWFKNKLEVTDDTHISIESLEGCHTLTISNMNTRDEGTYICSSSSEDTKRSFELSMKGPPIHRQVYAKLGQKVVLEYKSLDYSYSLGNSVMWIKKKQNVREDTNISIRCIHGIHTLTIFNMTKRHIGIYRCSGTAEHTDMIFELTIKDIRVPVALVVVHGDLDTLDYVMRAVNNDISVVVVKGTGGAADLIALCQKDYSSKSLKRKLPVLFTVRFTKELLSRIETICTRITEKDWLISIFDINVDKHEKLWERISDGIIRAWSFEEAHDEAKFQSIKEEKSISKHVAKIDELNRTELFAGYSSYNADQQGAFITAFLCENTTIIQQMLSKETPFELSEENFDKLWRQLIASTSRDGICNILQDVYPGDMNNPKKAVKDISEKLLKGLCLSEIGMVTCCTPCCHKKDNKIEGSLDELNEPQIHTIEILRVAVYFDKKLIAAELWYQNDFQIMTALIASMYLTSLANTAKQGFEENLQKEYQSHAKMFLSRAISLFDKMFSYDESVAIYALENVSNVWDYMESPLHFGRQFSIEEFISLSANQKNASKALFSFGSSYENNEDGTTKNAYPSHIKEWALFVKHHWKNSKLAIFTAPVTRIFFHIVFFLAALIIFSYFITGNLEAGSISVLEVYIFLYMLGDLLEEFWSMVRPEKGCNWSPQRILLHLYDIWNILDFLCVTLYIIGFCMHIFDQNSIVATRRIYSIALFIMFLRLLNLLLLFKRFGIIIIMVKEMLVDLLDYLVILIIFIFAAGVVYHANVYPNHQVKGSSDIEFWRIWKIIKIPYWQVYGELYLDTLEASDPSSCTDNATIWQNDPSVERCPTGDWITPVIAAFYMMLTNWLLLNIVIAMFSARFDAIQERSEEKWRYYRHSVIFDFEDRIPSPLNFPFRILSLLDPRIYPCFSKGEGGANNKWKQMLEMQRQFAQEIIHEEKFQNT